MRGPCVLVLPGLLAGCPSGPDPAPAGDCGGTVDCAAVREDDPELQIGGGSPSGPVFEPLGGDPHLYLEYGPQGGYHVYLAARTKGLCPTVVRMTRVLRVAGEALVHRTMQTRVRLVEDDEGFWVVSRATETFVCPATLVGQQMWGVPLEVDFALEEDETCVSEGEEPRSVSGTVRLTADCQPGDDVCRTDDQVGCAEWDGT